MRKHRFTNEDICNAGECFREDGSLDIQEFSELLERLGFTREKAIKAAYVLSGIVVQYRAKQRMQ